MTQGRAPFFFREGGSVTAGPRVAGWASMASELGVHQYETVAQPATSRVGRLSPAELACVKTKAGSHGFLVAAQEEDPDARV